MFGYLTKTNEKSITNKSGDGVMGLDADGHGLGNDAKWNIYKSGNKITPKSLWNK